LTEGIKSEWETISGTWKHNLTFGAYSTDEMNCVNMLRLN
ncbi:unnamed protein product, partial [marine sediment metagenome]